MVAFLVRYYSIIYILLLKQDVLQAALPKHSRNTIAWVSGISLKPFRRVLPAAVTIARLFKVLMYATLTC